MAYLYQSTPRSTYEPMAHRNDRYQAHRIIDNNPEADFIASLSADAPLPCVFGIDGCKGDHNEAEPCTITLDDDDSYTLSEGERSQLAEAAAEYSTDKPLTLSTLRRWCLPQCGCDGRKRSDSCYYDPSCKRC